MHFKQVQRFFLSEKNILGLGALKHYIATTKCNDLIANINLHYTYKNC